MPEHEMTGNPFLLAKARYSTAKMSEKSRAEVALIKRICAGDEHAFGEFYGRFAPLVHGILLTRLPRDEVEDAVQEVFISAFANLHNLRDQSSGGSWLAMIARNRAAEFYRNGKPTEELSENLQSRPVPTTEAREVLNMIKSLPEAYRETLILRLVEGLTGPEIADQTGLTPDSVRVNLHRGMKLLRQKLGIEE